MPNLNSYQLGGVRAVFPPEKNGDVCLGLDTADGVLRMRVPIEHFRYLIARGIDELRQLDLSKLQSPISSGMPSSDGSPEDGQHV